MVAYNNEPPDKLLIHPVAILNGNRCLSALNGSSPKHERGSAADIAHYCGTARTVQPARLPNYELILKR